MSRRRQYLRAPTCEHNAAKKSSGYCLDCWRAALGRPFTVDEWQYLNASAVNLPKGWRPKATPHARPFKPAPVWNGTAVATITAGIAKSLDEHNAQNWQRPLDVSRYIGTGALGFAVVATDGSRMLATPHERPRPSGRSLGEYLDPAGYRWAQLGVGSDVALRRVLLIYDPDQKAHNVKIALDGPDLLLTVETRDRETASERVRLSWAPDPAGSTELVGMNGDWLTEVVRPGLQIGIAADRLMLRPADDSWRYVQMGVR